MIADQFLFLFGFSFWNKFDLHAKQIALIRSERQEWERKGKSKNSNSSNKFRKLSKRTIGLFLIGGKSSNKVLSFNEPLFTDLCTSKCSHVLQIVASRVYSIHCIDLNCCRSKFAHQTHTAGWTLLWDFETQERISFRCLWRKTQPVLHHVRFKRAPCVMCHGAIVPQINKKKHWLTS